MPSILSDQVIGQQASDLTSVGLPKSSHPLACGDLSEITLRRRLGLSVVCANLTPDFILRPGVAALSGWGDFRARVRQSHSMQLFDDREPRVVS